MFVYIQRKKKIHKHVLITQPLYKKFLKNSTLHKQIFFFHLKFDICGVCKFEMWKFEIFFFFDLCSLFYSHIRKIFFLISWRSSSTFFLLKQCWDLKPSAKFCNARDQWIWHFRNNMFSMLSDANAWIW